jgi:hypothetical protein
MIALRLVRLIEHHSTPLAEGLMHKLDASDRCSDLRKVPQHEIEERSREIYQHLSEWLVNKTEGDIEQTYRRIARRRFEQGVSLSQLYWAFVITKEHLWDYLIHEGATESPLDLRAGFELIRLMEQFFESAIYYMSVEYEELQMQGLKKLVEVAS